MRAHELRGLSADDLELKGRELRDEIFHLSLRRVTGQLENPMKVRQLRRDVARIETVKRERRAASESFTK
jgi:large subunit ribosomal protein L29